MVLRCAPRRCPAEERRERLARRVGDAAHRVLPAHPCRGEPPFSCSKWISTKEAAISAMTGSSPVPGADRRQVSARTSAAEARSARLFAAVISWNVCGPSCPSAPHRTARRRAGTRCRASSRHRRRAGALDEHRAPFTERTTRTRPPRHAAGASPSPDPSANEPSACRPARAATPSHRVPPQRGGCGWRSSWRRPRRVPSVGAPSRS